MATTLLQRQTLLVLVYVHLRFVDLSVFLLFPSFCRFFGFSPFSTLSVL